MDFGLSQEEQELRQEVRDFLKRELTSEVTEETESGLGLGPATFALLRKLGARGWLAPAWSREYEGLDASPMERYIIREELAYQGARPSLVGVDMAGPTILLYGTEQQKREYLPRIARREIEFALGYTEPQAGSDLASLEMRAVEDGDDFVLNGQKVFNSAGSRTVRCLTVSGLTPEGDDATNELSYIIMDAAKAMRFIYPTVAIRLHRNSSGLRELSRVPPERFADFCEHGLVMAGGRPWTGERNTRGDWYRLKRRSRWSNRGTGSLSL